MVMLNDLDRFHLVMDVIDRVPGLARARRAPAPADGRRAAAPPRLHARARRRPAAMSPTGRWPGGGPRQPGRRIGRSLRVLVVNAGSSSLKLALLDGEDAIARRTRSSPRRGRRSTIAAAARGARLGSRRGRRGRPPDRPRRRALPRGGEDRRGRRGRPARAGRPRAAAPAEVAGRAGRRERGAARPARGRLLRHRLPRDPARRRPRPTRCRRSGASAGDCAATASTASRTRGSPGARRSCSERDAVGAADRQLPPGRGRVAVRDRRRALARHDDGLHAARGARDGDPLGQRRPRDAAVAAGARGTVAAASWPTRSSTARACSGLAGSADMREVLRAGRRGRGRPPRAWRSTSTCTACAPGSPRWPRRSAASTRSCSPAASASARPRCVRRAAEGLAFLGVALDVARNSLAHSDAEIGGDGADVRCLVITAREDIEIARQVRLALSR